MLARSLQDFHQWLFLSAPVVARSIVVEPIHRDPEVLAWAVARELNERNPAYEGRWISFLPDVLEQIAADACERHLLGIPERLAKYDSLGCVCYAILKRGYVVLQGMAPAAASLGDDDIFQAAIGSSRVAHLNLAVSAVPNSLLPGRIVDAFLDWERGKIETPYASAEVTNRFGNRNISQLYRQQDSSSRLIVE